MGYFPDLLKQYKTLLEQMKVEGVTSGPIYREIKEAIFWMETGYDPAEYRAATRVDAYLMDPYDMQMYVAYINDDDMLMPEQLQVLYKQIVSRWIPSEDDKMKSDEFLERYFADFNYAVDGAKENKIKIRLALNGLTDNEKAAFIAVKAENMQYRKVANMLGVSSGSVQSYINRAMKKIQKNIGQANLNDSLELSA